MSHTSDTPDTSASSTTPTTSDTTVAPDAFSAAGPSAFRHLVGTWTDAYGHLATSVVEANRATMAAFGVSHDGRREPAPVPSLQYREGDWSFERTVDSFDRISVGDAVRFTKRLDDADVRAFARASGDTNRLHLDDRFAADSRFGGRIAHGTLASGLISAALARLPGLVVYLSQDLRFLAPVALGATLTAEVTVVEALGDGRYRLTTVVETDDGETVVDGEAVVLIDPLPGGDAGAGASA